MAAHRLELLVTRSSQSQIRLLVLPSCTIGEVKLSLASLSHLPLEQRPPPAEQQHLLFNGELLPNEIRLADTLQKYQVCSRVLSTQ